MHTTKRWNVDILVSEEAEGNQAYTWAEVGLVSPDLPNLRGHGVARKHPEDMDVPEIGEELAVSRALSDLARQLRQAAWQDIGESTGMAGIPLQR
ncbi:DUF1876 domain-containing protein [Lipingzhangella sp. LS1_29]|uniref:DUF1876 domain-containing protein n=1 Tax=Lipingzhangella rawalii TaxID=2055835 RepID=A0ABU2H2R3_9ACTN|nr:DUF1876 domain-containing protein [Lipingzhangella rawalii]MDS1269154.1 DUF1876 domain-containing protein [Lipingzhangella rawalii]